MDAKDDPETDTPETQAMFGPMVQNGIMAANGTQVPAFFVNGLAYGMSSTELTVMLMFANQPMAAIILAPSMAKTLGESLVQLLADYEHKTGQTIKGISELYPRDVPQP